jgi:hypothetical protein
MHSPLGRWLQQDSYRTLFKGLQEHVACIRHFTFCTNVATENGALEERVSRFADVTGWENGDLRRPILIFLFLLM